MSRTKKYFARKVRAMLSPKEAFIANLRWAEHSDPLVNLRRRMKAIRRLVKAQINNGYVTTDYWVERVTNNKKVYKYPQKVITILDPYLTPYDFPPQLRNSLSDVEGRFTTRLDLHFAEKALNSKFGIYTGVGLTISDFSYTGSPGYMFSEFTPWHGDQGNLYGLGFSNDHWPPHLNKVIWEGSGSRPITNPNIVHKSMQVVWTNPEWLQITDQSAGGHNQRVVEIGNLVDFLREINQLSPNKAGQILYSYMDKRPLFIQMSVDDKSKPHKEHDFIEAKDPQDPDYEYMNRVNAIASNFFNEFGDFEVRSALLAQLEKQVQQLDLGILLGELNETTLMLLDIIHHAVRALQIISKPTRFVKDFNTFLSHARRTFTSKRWRVFKSKLKQSANKLAAFELFIQFGILPLLSDIRDLVAIAQRGLRLQNTFKVSHFQKFKSTNLSLDMPGSWVIHDHTVKQTSVEYQVNVEQFYEISDATQFLLGALGLTQPLRTFLELIPLSFIPNWFVPLSDLIANNDSASLGLSLVEQWVGIKCTVSFDNGASTEGFVRWSSHLHFDMSKDGPDYNLPANVRLMFAIDGTQTSKQYVKINGIEELKSLYKSLSLASLVTLHITNDAYTYSKDRKRSINRYYGDKKLRRRLNRQYGVTTKPQQSVRPPHFSSYPYIDMLDY